MGTLLQGGKGYNWVKPLGQAWPIPPVVTRHSSLVSPHHHPREVAEEHSGHVVRRLVYVKSHIPVQHHPKFSLGGFQGERSVERHSEASNLVGNLTLRELKELARIPHPRPQRRRLPTATE